MKIYAIRDRLIGYYMAPFAGPDQHADVLAAVATQVNANTGDAIAEAPHHFEIWTLGEVDEEGHITPKREFLADCSSLIRTGIRRGTARPSGNQPPDRPEIESGAHQGADRSNPGTPVAPVGNPAQEPAPAVKEAHPRPG